MNMIAVSDRVLQKQLSPFFVMNITNCYSLEVSASMHMLTNRYLISPNSFERIHDTLNVLQELILQCVRICAFKSTINAGWPAGPENKVAYDNW